MNWGIMFMLRVPVAALPSAFAKSMKSSVPIIRRISLSGMVFVMRPTSKAIGSLGI